MSTTATATVADPLGLVVFFLVGLLGGAHCLGMCGPFVTRYADHLADEDPGVAPHAVHQHLLFNLGRTGGYATIGGILGAAGGLTLDLAGLASIGRNVRMLTGLLAGALIIVVGAQYALRGRAPIGHDLPLLGGLFGRMSSLLSARVSRWVHGPQVLGLGAMHGLLPCPLLYPAFLYAFVIGSPMHGAVALATLGLGTIPSLFAYGTVLGSLSRDRRIQLHRGLGVSFLFLGYIPLSMGLRLAGIDVPTIPVPFYQPLS